MIVVVVTPAVTVAVPIAVPVMIVFKPAATSIPVTSRRIGRPRNEARPMRHPRTEAWSNTRYASDSAVPRDTNSRPPSSSPAPVLPAGRARREA